MKKPTPPPEEGALENPYGHLISSANDNSRRFQCDIDAEDKAALQNLCPRKGITQLIVLNLIKNLINDLKDLQIYGTYQSAGDAIYTVLLQRRKLTFNQGEQLRCAITPVPEEIPQGLLHSGRGSAIREAVTDAPSEQRNAPKRTGKGKQRTGKGTNPEGGETESHV